MSIKKLFEAKQSTKNSEGIFIPLKVGDIILRGKFRNQKVKVKEISFDKHGLPLVNGRAITNFRFFKEESENESE